MEKISIIVPCYNEEESVPLFYAEAVKELNKIKLDFEIIYVDDGSTDHTLEVVKKLSDDKSVKYISFSRNFGKEAAMLAGLEASTGDYVTIMDVDLQDPPSMLKEMLRLIKEDGYDIVGTRRVTRKGEPPIRSFFARCFYKIINKICIILFSMSIVISICAYTIGPFCLQLLYGLSFDKFRILFCVLVLVGTFNCL